MRALLRPLPIVLVGIAGGCVPAEDVNEKEYGSVEFDLAVTKTTVTDFTDGWTFTVEHLLMAPSCNVNVGAYGNSCQNSPDDGDGNTIVDLVTGAAFDINAITDGPCSDLNVTISGGDIAGVVPVVGPGIPSAAVTAFQGTADMFGGPGLLLLGTAHSGTLTKRVSLGFGANTVAVSGDCLPMKGGQPVLIDIPNVRQYFHFDFDVERFFPGSPPSFGPVANADTNDDGVVTWQELVRANLSQQIGEQLNRAWRLRPEDGLCAGEEDAGTADAGRMDVGTDGL
jgi:hypothetical protein